MKMAYGYRIYYFILSKRDEEYRPTQILEAFCPQANSAGDALAYAAGFHGVLRDDVIRLAYCKDRFAEELGSSDMSIVQRAWYCYREHYCCDDFQHYMKLHEEYLHIKTQKAKSETVPPFWWDKDGLPPIDDIMNITRMLCGGSPKE
jgi:hypothetical protein